VECWELKKWVLNSVKRKNHRKWSKAVFRSASVLISSSFPIYFTDLWHVVQNNSKVEIEKHNQHSIVLLLNESYSSSPLTPNTSCHHCVFVLEMITLHNEICIFFLFATLHKKIALLLALIENWTLIWKRGKMRWGWRS